LACHWRFAQTGRLVRRQRPVNCCDQTVTARGGFNYATSYTEIATSSSHNGALCGAPSIAIAQRRAGFLNLQSNNNTGTATITAWRGRQQQPLTVFVHPQVRGRRSSQRNMLLRTTRAQLLSAGAAGRRLFCSDIRQPNAFSKATAHLPMQAFDGPRATTHLCRKPFRSHSAHDPTLVAASGVTPPGVFTFDQTQRHFANRNHRYGQHNGDSGKRRSCPQALHYLPALPLE